MLETKEDNPQRLIEFLQNRDAPCPLCGYNLRNLTENTCPECHQTLQLTVGVHNMRFGWFLATVTPGLFSGIAAILMLTLVLVSTIKRAGPLPPVIFLLALFGLISGTIAMILITRRHHFVQLRPQVQRTWALTIWTIHALPFLALLALVLITA
jgi:hypothetical protein